MRKIAFPQVVGEPGGVDDLAAAIANGLADTAVQTHLEPRRAL